MKTNNMILLLFLSLLFFVSSIKVFAHDSNLGWDGYDGTTYDECQAKEYVDANDIGDGYYEKWYDLIHYSNFLNLPGLCHISTDTQTIYYSFDDTNPDDWIVNDDEESANIIKSTFEESMLKWNNVYYYEYLGNNFYFRKKIIKLVNYDTLPNKAGIEPNLIIYPDGDTSSSVLARTEPVYSSLSINVLLLPYQVHYSKFKITILVNGYYDSLPNNRTGAHEIGHVLGLADMDVNCKVISNEHHEELLMGYGYPTQMNITYKDIAGVSITRGFHTNNNHLWLYEDNHDEGHKLICSLCNCVKYVDDLNDYDYLEYQSCNHNPLNLPTTLDEYMIPVASYGNTDYYKCKYCRYVASFESRVTQNYGDWEYYSDSYHMNTNYVTNLTYNILDEHDFSILVAPGVYKCSECGYCNNNCICDEIDLSCLSTNNSDTLTFDINDGYFYKLNIECNKMYKFLLSSVSETKLELYDSNMSVLNTFDINVLQANNKYLNSIEVLLNQGTYYINICHENISNQDDIMFSYQAKFPESNILNIDSSFDCLPLHAHTENGDTNYHRVIQIHNNIDSNLYEVLITGTRNNNPFICNSGMIKVYSNYEERELAYKYNFSQNEYEYAINNEGDSRMIVSFPYKGYFYLEVTTSTNDYSNLDVYVSSLYEETINLFNYSDNYTGWIYYGMIQGLGDRIKKVEVKQDCNASLNAIYGGTSLDDILIVMMRKDYIEGSLNKECVFTKVFSGNVNDFSFSTSGIVNLPAGTYYIGCFNNNSNGLIEIYLTRQLIQYGSNVLIPDLASAELQGSEINILEQNVPIQDRSYGSTVITQGFTRLIYLNSSLVDEESREDYYWYSSNDSIATVTKYGTVRGVGVGTVKIMAVYKYDFRIAFVKEFSIVSDVNVVDMVLYNVILIDYNEETNNGTFRLELENMLCPYPLYQLYTWSVVIHYGYPDFTVLLDGYANVTINGLGNFTLYGLYYTSYGNTITVSINISIYE